MIKRKRDVIKVLDVAASTQDLARSGLQCHNCKERHYFVPRAGDNLNLFCTNCGSLTPIRTIKRSRGLSAPVVQQQTVIVQNSANKTIAKRKPKGVNDGKKSELEQSLIEKGFTVIDSQTIEPTR